MLNSQKSLFGKVFQIEMTKMILAVCLPIWIPFQKTPLVSRNVLHSSTHPRPQPDQYSTATLTCHKITTPRCHFTQLPHVAWTLVNAAIQSSRSHKVDSMDHYSLQHFLGFSSRDVFLQTWHTFLRPVALRPLHLPHNNLPICRPQSNPRMTKEK